MRLLPLLLVSVLAIVTLPSVTAYRRRYACGVCEAMVDEMNLAIADVQAEKDHMVQTKWRIDEKRRIPYARTEHVLLDILEHKMTGKLASYGIDQGSSGTNGHIKISKNNGVENSNFTSNAEVTRDIKETFEYLLEEHMETITYAFHKDVPNVKEHLCIKKMKTCRVKKVNNDKKKKKKQRRRRVIEEDKPATISTTTTDATGTTETTTTTTSSSDPVPTEPAVTVTIPDDSSATSGVDTSAAAAAAVPAHSEL